MGLMDIPDSAPATPSVNYRKFDDILGQRKSIYDQAARGVTSGRPLSNASYRLEIADVGYDKEDFDPQPEDEKKFILQRGSLHRPMKATFRLYNQADDSLVEEQRATIANVPHLNGRGLFIRKGVNWGLRNQLRLRPGIYTRRKANGQVESHFNVKPGTGRGFRIMLEPESGVFKMQIGQSTTKLFPLLRAMGVSDDQMKEQWGEELYNKNFQVRGGSDFADMRKVLSKLGPSDIKIDDDRLMAQALLETINKTEVDEDSTELTLGSRIKNLSPEVLVQATGKILRVATNEAQEDNRDSQAFQTIHSAEDLVEERLRRDQAGTLRKLLWKATKSGKLGTIPSGVMNSNLNALFEKSGLGATVEDINPFEIYDIRQAVSRMGEGGIASEDSVSRDARAVQASYLGVVDSGRGPECYDNQTEVMTQGGWKKWESVTGGDQLACLVGGALQFNRPTRLIRSFYEGEMFGARNRNIDYLVTPSHRMYSRTDGSLRDGRPCAFKITDPSYIEGKSRLFLSAGFTPWEAENPLTTFKLPTVTAERATSGSRNKPPVGASLINVTEPINMVDWASFLGWYLSEGYVSCTPRQGGRNNYATRISQSDTASPANIEKIKKLLSRLPFSWSYSSRATAFTVGGKQLALYLQQFGHSADKYIPEYLFNSTVEARTALFNALMEGDGKHWHGEADDIRTYHTGSSRLAKDFIRLAFSLGKSTRETITVDDRKESYLDIHGIYVHTRTVREVCHKSKRRDGPDYYRTQYKGEVFCAEVPGGLLYVRRNNCVGFWCGNSSRMGLDLRLTDAALKGSDGLLYTRVRNTKTGDIETISARDLAKSTVAFPNEWANDSKRVAAVRNDGMDYVTRDEVDYEILNPNAMMSRASAMIPFAEAMQGKRLLMGSRMTQQALPLKDAEAPLVQTGDADDISLHQKMGEFMGARVSPIEGQVTAVSPTEIRIKDADGNERVVGLYNNYPLARKTVLHNEPLVQPGDTVRAGDTLAKSNFTNSKGTTAIGRNLRTAWMSASGSTLEDAVVISESAAKKLMSEGMYKTDLDLEGVKSTKKADFQAVYSDKFSPEQYERLDEDGVVVPGTKVEAGDPLVLAMSNKQGRAIGALMDTPKSSVSNNSKLWDHNAPGMVTDVEKTRKGIRVTVKTYDTTRMADKLTTRFGSKGVVSEIRPDDQMPVDEKGQPIEVILNSFGVISRVNPAAMAEALLGKVAEVRGQPYVIKPFATPKAIAEFATEEALKYGVIKKDADGKVVDTETLTDPRDGRKIKNIFTGNSYMMKLHHTAESKLSARDQAGYTQEGLPAKGGPTGAKRVGMLDSYSLIAAGATEFMKDAKLIRGQRNDDYWRAIRNGELAVIPERSLSNDMFRDQLTAAGVKLRQNGSRTGLSPLLDRDVDELAQKEIESGDTFNFDTMEPIDGGLFDKAATGGGDGNRFSKITLPIKVPHPLFVDPIQRLLGLTGKEMQSIMKGEERLHGKTGAEAIERALAGINIDREMGEAKATIKSGARSHRDAAVKKLNYLTGLKKFGITADELMVSKIPVIPPKYRPITRANGTEMVHDLNYLYKDLLTARENYQQAMTEFGSAGDEYSALADAVQAISGVRDPVNPKSVEQGVGGILRHAIGVGKSPKYATFQRKVIGSAVDNVGRGTITADADLDMDEVSIPAEIAWTSFRPFVIRRLTRSGYSAQEALKSVKERNPSATRALKEEMSERPVVYNRAPSLHKYSYVGAWGKLREHDDAIGLPYHVLKGIGGDYDGDNVNIHVPSSAEAVDEVKNKLFPSKNLFHSATYETHLEPTQDYLAGLYLASRPDKREATKTFDTVAEARKAFAKGEISLRTPIRILQPKPVG